MTALQVRDVPDDMRESLARGASAREEPLQAYLRDVLGWEARSALNRQFLRGWRPVRGDGHGRVDAVGALRAVREERDAHIASVFQGGAGGGGASPRSDASIVVDASAVVELLTDSAGLADELGRPLAEDAEWAVPEHAVVECASALRGLWFGGECTQPQFAERVCALAQLSFVVYPPSTFFARAIELAQCHHV